MGKGALIGVIALSFLAILTLLNTQSISRETSDRQIEFQTGYMAKELAMKGRKLIISSWIKNNGSNADDIASINEDGGTITLLADTVKQLSGNEIAFTVRGVYDGSVHEVTSRLRWGALLSSPMQMKVPDLDLTVSPSATLNMSDFALDTQSLEDLEQIVVNDLNLVAGLSSLSLGESVIVNEIETELTNAGFTDPYDPGVFVIDEVMRSEFENSQEGIHYPDQVIQMINDYVNTHPGSEFTIGDASSIPGTFGSSLQKVLRVQNNVTLGSDLTGEGVLIIEGDFNVPSDVTFNWTGIVVVAPPAGQLSGTIDLSGTVNINGVWL